MFSIPRAARVRRSALKALLVCASGLPFAALAAGTPALAQSVETPPIRSSVDANGVDLISGGFNPSSVDLTIGRPGSGGLSYGRTFLGSAVYPNSIQWQSTLDGTAYATATGVTVSVGFSTESFTLSGSTYYSTQGTGSTLVTSGTGLLTYTLTTRDGTVYVFQPFAGQVSGASLLTTATHPSGEVETYTYNTGTFTNSGASFAVARLQSVTNNLGYQIQIQYASNALAADGSNYASWSNRTVVTGINNAIDYCAPSANVCSGLTYAWPTVTYGSPGTNWGTTVTDATGARTTTFLYDSNGRIDSVKLPSGLTKVITYDANGRVASVAGPAGTWSYNFTISGSAGAVTVTGPNTSDPNNPKRTVNSNLTLGRMTSDTDGRGYTTSYGYDTFGRLTSVTLPEGNATTFTYDSQTLGVTRGNVVTTTRSPKSGSPLQATTTSVAYDATCASPAKCNLPNSTTDANGNITNYTYDATHGVLLTVTPPVPQSGAVQPQTRLGYTLSYAYYKNAVGNITQAATPVDMLTSISACQTQAAASCPGTADEAKSTITYGAPNTANNLLPTSVTSKAGDGSVSSTASQTYDPVGNVQATVGPLGANQTTVNRYDADRELVSTIGPNPGSSEGLQFPAKRITYNLDGLVTEAEVGYDTTQSDSNFATFSSLQQRTTTYDNVDRATMQTVTAGGATYNVTQFAYDNANRLTCAAARMNPAVFGSISSTWACDLGTVGANGPDRIVANAYDAADELTQTTIAYGTAKPANYATYTYSHNGQAQTILDADNNLTTQVYDGFDRLSQVQYPSKTQGAGVSDTADTEAYVYDKNDNVTSFTTRSGDAVGFVVDALNRVYEKTVPSWSGQNVYFGYDLLNRMTKATFGSPSGSGVAVTYDALSHKTSETSQGVTISSQYDAAGDRTQLTWPDGVYINYTYDYLQRVRQVEQQGATSGLGLLNVYQYDNLGHLTNIARGNTTSTSYTYNSAGQLSSQAQTYVNSSLNVTWHFTYDAADKILTRTANNDSYTYHPPVQTQTYVTNGLNQYSSVSGVSYTYDARGNLTADGVRTFTYDVDNHLLTGSAPSQTLTQTFDPLGRSSVSTQNGTALAYVRDGADLLGDYLSGAISQRHAPSGLRDGLPSVMFVGSGALTPNWYHSDNQGSRVSLSDSTGTGTGPFGFDPFGGSSSSGSFFRYTGQLGLYGFQLYEDGARNYDPNLGRFLQADPAGYADDLNSYAYVHNDPVNLTDPTGLAADPGVAKKAEDAGGGAWTTGEIDITGAGPFRGGFSVFGVNGSIPSIGASMSNGGINGLSGGGGGAGDAVAELVVHATLPKPKPQAQAVPPVRPVQPGDLENAQSACSAAQQRLAFVGMAMEKAGEGVTLGSIAGGAIAAIGLPETLGADSPVIAFAGAGTTMGAITSAYGIALQGVASHGPLYGLSSGLLSLATGKLEDIAVGGVLKNEQAKMLASELLDKGLSLLHAEESACGAD